MAVFGVWRVTMSASPGFARKRSPNRKVGMRGRRRTVTVVSGFSRLIHFIDNPGGHHAELNMITLISQTPKIMMSEYLLVVHPDDQTDGYSTTFFKNTPPSSICHSASPRRNDSMDDRGIPTTSNV